MIDGAAKLPPLWPGSTRTTLPSRMPLAVGGNRPGPPLAAAGSVGGPSDGGWLASGAACVLAVAAACVLACGAAACVLAWGAASGWPTAWPADPMVQADRTIARTGTARATRRIRSPCPNRSAADGVALHAAGVGRGVQHAVPTGNRADPAEGPEIG